MPVYEYTCNRCGKELELLVPSSRSKPACIHCGSRKLTRRLSAFAAHSGSSASLPCSAGQCPAGSAAPGSCVSGTCPFSS